MTTPRMSILAATVLLALTSCEQSQPPTKGRGTGAQPATSGPTTAPTTQTPTEALNRLGEEAGRTAEAAKALAASVTNQIRAAYEDHVRLELIRVDEHINDLQKELANASEAARPAIQEQLAVWRQRAATIRDKLSSLQGAGDQAWLDLKKDLDSALNQVRGALGPPTTRPASAPTTQPRP
jgi:hypothetical protein